MKKILAQWPFYLPLLGILFGFFITNHIQTQTTLLIVFLALIGCFIVYKLVTNWKFAYFVFLIFAICGFIRQSQVNKQLKFDILLAQKSKCVKYKLKSLVNLKAYLNEKVISSNKFSSF